MPSSGTPLTSIVPLRATIVRLSRPFELRTTGGSRNVLPVVNGGANGGCWLVNAGAPWSPHPGGKIGALFPCAAASEQHVVAHVSTAAVINRVRIVFTPLSRARRDAARPARTPRPGRWPGARRHGQRRDLSGRAEHASTKPGPRATTPQLG